jgi:hypothetical protein
VSEDDLFQAGDPFDDLPEYAAETPKRGRNAGLIGCPVVWLKRVLPLVHSKEQLAVAVWLHRRRAVCRSEVFSVPNRELHEELGLSRWTKYRALDGLEEAGVIAVIRNGQRAMLVRLLW